MPHHLISDAHEWINEIPTVAMDLPSELPSDLPLSNFIFRGGGGQLGVQAQAILSKLAQTVEPKCAKVCELLGLNKATRLSGLLAHLTNLDRTVVIRHLAHLQGEDARIKVPVNAGGRKRKAPADGSDDLPLELPPVSGGAPVLPLLVPICEDLQLRQPLASGARVPLEVGPAILCGVDDDSGMKLAIVFVMFFIFRLLEGLPQKTCCLGFLL